MLTKSNLITWTGIAVLLAAVALAMPRWQFIREARVAEGVVIGLEFGGAHPKIAFRLPSQKQVVYQQGGLIAAYKLGDKVRVLYLDDDPRRSACIDTPGAVWAMPAMLTLVSFILLAAGRP